MPANPPRLATAFPLSHGQKRPRERSEAHLDFIRSLPCVLTGQPAEAAHVRYASLEHGKRATGAGEKPSDRWTVPLCPEAHRLGNESQHSMGERDFWQKNDMDPLIVAALLWAVSGDWEAGMHVISHARQTAPWRP